MYKVGSVVYEKRISEIYFVSSFCSLPLFLSLYRKIWSQISTGPAFSGAISLFSFVGWRQV